MAFSTPSISTFQSLGESGGTTSAIDTTGADLLIVVVSSTHFGSNPTVSDSKGNTWTALTRYSDSGGDVSIKFFYAVAPSVGSGHTFTASGASMYASMGVIGLVGGKQTSPFDQQAGSAASGTSLTPGSVTPTESDEIVLSAINVNPASTASADGGFSVIGYVSLVGGVSLGLAVAYLIQTSAAAANPTWSWTGSQTSIAANATFKAAAASAAGHPARKRMGGMVGNPFRARGVW